MGKYFIPIFFLVILFACENGDKVRNYKEKNSTVKNTQKIAPETEKTLTRKIIWKVPPGWIEKKARGIRLATFDIKFEDQYALCTIVPLRGDGGGIKANIQRWLIQLGIEFESEEKLDNFILEQKKFKTEQNIQATSIDFSPLVQSPDQQIMLALILRFPQETVFIKMTGKKFILLKNKEKFELLGHSLRIVQH